MSSGRGRPHSRASREGRFWPIRHRVVAAVAGAASGPTLSAAAAGRTGSAKAARCRAENTPMGVGFVGQRLPHW